MEVAMITCNHCGYEGTDEDFVYIDGVYYCCPDCENDFVAVKRYYREPETI